MNGPSPSTVRDYRERVLRVLVHIQQHLDGELPLGELAGVACFSPFHFHRVFRGMVGESVAQHVRRLRLERAAMHLKHGERPITAVALDAGYETHESFTRAFRAAFGCPPSRFREVAAGATTTLATPSGVHFAEGERQLSFAPLTLKEGEMAAEIKTLAPLRVAFIRHVGPYDEVGETWARLAEWAGANCLFGPDTRLFGACYDDPDVTPRDKIRYAACITLDAPLPPEGEVGMQTIPGGRYAVVLHEGPYQGLGDTYAHLFGRWLAEHHLEPGDPPSLEFYLNDPHDTPAEELLTEVWAPIRA